MYRYCICFIWNSTRAIKPPRTWLSEQSRSTLVNISHSRSSIDRLNDNLLWNMWQNIGRWYAANYLYTHNIFIHLFKNIKYFLIYYGRTQGCKAGFNVSLYWYVLAMIRSSPLLTRRHCLIWIDTSWYYRNS